MPSENPLLNLKIDKKRDTSVLGPAQFHSIKLYFQLIWYGRGEFRAINSSFLKDVISKEFFSDSKRIRLKGDERDYCVALKWKFWSFGTA